MAAVLFVVLSVLQARADSITVDEGPDLAAGVSALVHRDLRITPEHGILPHVVAALPALRADPVVPEGVSWRSGDWFAYTDDFVRANDEAGRLDDLVLLARLAGVAQGVAAALLVHLLAARWFGRDAALVAALAWLTTPLVVGLHHTALIDPGTTVAVLALVLAATRLVEVASDRRAVVVGMAFGALLLCRHSGLPLVALPVGAAFAASTVTRDRLRRVALMGLAALAVVWVGYRTVDPSGPEGGRRDRFEAIVDRAGDDSLPATVVGASPLPLEWRAGFGQLVLSSEEKTASLLGRTWEGARPWYYPVSLLLASPPLTAALLVVGWVGLFRVPSRRRRSALVLAGCPMAIVLLTLLAQPLQLGPRLALPVLALGIVLGSAALADRPRGRGLGAAAVGLALVQVGLLVASHPGSIGWTPPPLRPSYWWAGAAATDLGQDLTRLERWAEEHRPLAVAVVSSRGYPPIGGARRLRDVPAEDVRGWVAVSASALITFGGGLSWLRAYCPIEQVGQSILVYRFRSPPDTRPGPAFPERPCPDELVSRRRI